VSKRLHCTGRSIHSCAAVPAATPTVRVSPWVDDALASLPGLAAPSGVPVPHAGMTESGAAISVQQTPGMSPSVNRLGARGRSRFMGFVGMRNPWLYALQIR
jgi:hypothetical protein